MPGMITLENLGPRDGLLAAIEGTLSLNEDEREADEAFESVLDYAMESIFAAAVEAAEARDAKSTKTPKGHIIAPKVRDALPDNAFGIPSARKYPLIVKNDPAVSKELITKAIQMFHYCKPEWKKELAGNIIKAIRVMKLDIKINSKSMICKYTKVPPEMLAGEDGGVKPKFTPTKKKS